MGFKQLASYLYNKNMSALVQWKYFTRKVYHLDRQAAELIRNSHSIEKGLSIKEEEIRLGFGHAKQLEMLDRIALLKSSPEAYHQEAVKMALATLNSYVLYHQARDYTDDVIEEIKQTLSKFMDQIKTWDTCGGVLEYQAPTAPLDEQTIQQLFFTRHSIRDFDDTPVDQELIKQAVRMAQRCPSACNRQAVRVYNISKSDDATMEAWLSGSGGFAGHIQNFLMITGKITAYRFGELSQFLVSASMFAAYLSLALHALGLGNCVIQRRVEWSKAWEDIKKRYNIPDDEQVICVIGVGNLKPTTKVPVSHRLPVEVIYKTFPGNKTN